MSIIAIESSSSVASVAVIEADRILASYTLNHKMTHSQTIMPMLEHIKTMIGLDLQSVEAIVVSEGPGSYTGLRIGSATAKGLAQVLEVPIIGVSTLESLAYNLDEIEGLIVPMLDARRKHVYCAAYQWENGELQVVLPIDLRSVEELAQLLEERNQPLTLLGDGAMNHQQLIETHFKDLQWKKARPTAFLASAATLGFVGLEKMSRGEVADYMTHQPNYYRPSQAARNLQQ